MAREQGDEMGQYCPDDVKNAPDVLFPGWIGKGSCSRQATEAGSVHNSSKPPWLAIWCADGPSPLMLSSLCLLPWSNQEKEIEQFAPGSQTHTQ